MLILENERLFSFFDSINYFSYKRKVYIGIIELSMTKNIRYPFIENKGIV